MANEIAEVLVSVGVKLPNSNAIILETVIENAAGSFSDTIQGGQMLTSLTLTHGSEVRKLKKDEAVLVRGVLNGKQFQLPGVLVAMHVERPWQFQGKSGSTGA